MVVHINIGAPYYLKDTSRQSKSKIKLEFQDNKISFESFAPVYEEILILLFNRHYDNFLEYQEEITGENKK